MKVAALIPNVYLTILSVVFVVVGTVVYTPPATPVPVKESETPAVLSQTTPAVVVPPEVAPVLPIQLPIQNVQIPQLPILTPPIPPPPTISDATSIQNQADAAIQNLENDDTAAMLSLFSSDLTSTYSASELAVALSTSGQQIQSFRNLGDPNITGDYADQNVEVTTNMGTDRYQVFLHKENGTWKLMGTESIP